MNVRRLLLLLLCLTAFPSLAHAQALAPSIHPQFLDNSGKPLAGGFLFTYAAGTTNLQATYTDPGLTIANANPIPLDATGAPSNNSGSQVEIWLSNNSYKFCAYSSAMVQQWCSDGITTFLGILNQANTWTFTQTFTQPIVETATDNQLIFGALGNQTTLDLPPPTGNVTLHTPNISDTLVGRTTTDTLTNKTLTAPTMTNPVLNGVNPQTGTSYTVAASDEQKLVTLNNASAIAVTIPQATTTGFGSGAKFSFRNLGGGGNVTLTPTPTSTIDGVASITLAPNQGTDVYSDGTNYWTQPGRSNGGATKLLITSNCAVTGTTLANCTGISFPVLASQNYQVSCSFIFNATAGSMLGYTWTGPPSPASVNFAASGNPAITAFGSTQAVGTSQIIISPFSLSLLNGPNAGTVQLQIFDNTAGQTATLYAGSYCTVQ